MRAWLRRYLRVLGPRSWSIRVLPDDLWLDTLGRFPFLPAASEADGVRLRRLVGAFLASKEFTGARGLVVTDEMAVTVAAQACLPLLHLAPPDAPEQAIAWYEDFVGIVLHPDEVLARREWADEHGIVHHWREALSGEAMEGGPVMLSWPDVAAAGETAAHGYNVVIHEFAHKLDQRDGTSDGCPPLPAGFLGHASRRQARTHWCRVLGEAFERFQDRVIRHERFGGEPTWLDPYGAEAPDEFFAVTCEAYFVNRPELARELPELLPLFDAFFHPAPEAAPPA